MYSGDNAPPIAKNRFSPTDIPDIAFTAEFDGQPNISLCGPPVFWALGIFLCSFRSPSAVAVIHESTPNTTSVLYFRLRLFVLGSFARVLPLPRINLLHNCLYTISQLLGHTGQPRPVGVPTAATWQ